MKVRNSLKSAKNRDRNCVVVRRRGRVYVINKRNTHAVQIHFVRLERPAHVGQALASGKQCLGLGHSGTFHRAGFDI